MKHKRSIIALFSFLAFVFMMPAEQVYAANRIGFYLTPESSSVVNGSQLSVKFMVDITNRYPGAIGIGGKILYPKNILQVVNIDASQSNYTMYASTSFDNNAGTISFSRSNYFPEADSTYVFTINFKAVAPGTASVVFDKSTEGQNYPPTYAKGGTYTSYTPSCPQGQTGTPPNCRTPVKPVTPAPSPQPSQPAPSPQNTASPTQTATDAPLSLPGSDTEPVQVDAGDLSIKDVKLSASWKETTATWSTSLGDSDSTLDIGKSKETLNTKATIEKQDDGTYKAALQDLTPGTKYFYRITATSQQDSEKKATYSGAFITKGYPVVLKFSKDNQPAIGAKVKLDNGTYTTDKNGSISLELANKKFTAAVASDGAKEQTVSFTVAGKTIPKNGSEPELQTFQFAISDAEDDSTAPIPVGIVIASIGGIIGMVSAGVGFLLYRKKRAEQLAAPALVLDDYSWQVPPQQNPAPDSTYVEEVTTENITDNPGVAINTAIVSSEQINSSDPRLTPYQPLPAESAPQLIEPYRESLISQDNSISSPIEAPQETITEQPPYETEELTIHHEPNTTTTPYNNQSQHSTRGIS
jgi:hypothetical protein